MLRNRKCDILHVTESLLFISFDYNPIVVATTAFRRLAFGRSSKYQQYRYRHVACSVTLLAMEARNSRYKVAFAALLLLLRQGKPGVQLELANTS
jgi:hypothetical protein